MIIIKLNDWKYWQKELETVKRILNTRGLPNNDRREYEHYEQIIIAKLKLLKGN